jgi:hypothetical protein
MGAPWELMKTGGKMKNIYGFEDLKLNFGRILRGQRQDEFAFWEDEL